MRSAIKFSHFIAALSLALFSTAPTATSMPAADPFPAPLVMTSQIGFWTKVYVEIETSAGFIHDDRNLDVIYETMQVSSHWGTRQRQIKARKKHWRRALQVLAGGTLPRSADMRAAAASLTRALGRTPTQADYKAAAEGLRFQRGQRDRFRAGLIRSGRYEAEVRRILEDKGIPSDLAYLPHVESSFNTYAYSKFGAAGMWQFMPATGRRYMRIDAVVDERLDATKATHAAAKLLSRNFKLLGNWPLAITAYNHGAHGMKRAKRSVGSSDIGTIIARYNGRRFGFASRNFYAQFLAARNVARDYRRHFGAVEFAKPMPLQVVTLPFFADGQQLLTHLGMSRKAFAALNPSLREAVFRSEKFIPSGFPLHLPPDRATHEREQQLAAIPPQHRYDAQRATPVHRVRRGETLSQIAKRYDTTVRRLMALNGLKNPNRIRIGQSIALSTKAAAVASSKSSLSASWASAAISVRTRDAN